MRRNVAVALALAACAGKAEGTATLVTGPEEGVLTRAPAVQTLVAEAIAADGTVRTLARASLPIDTLDLGDFLKDETGSLRVRGEDATGTARVEGESLPFRYGAVESGTIRIFLQRKGESARFPSPFASAFPSKLVTVVASRYIAGVEGTRMALYDLASLAPVSDRVLPVAPTSLVVFDTRVFLVSDAVKATVLDLSDSSQTELDAPTGGTFSEVAGGATVHASDGVTYVVGATRTGAPTSRVLRIAADGTLSFAELSVPRRGAGVTWLSGRGLVVAGGSATGSGLEILAPGAAKGAPLPFPPDDGAELAIAALDSSRLVLVGQKAPFRTADLACTTSCATPALGGPPTLALTSPQASSFGTTVLATGTDATGTARAFFIEQSGTREIPLRTKRGRAALVPLPTGNVAIVGDAAELESFRP